ncbi:hypothetical protein Pmani_039005 [Petrolisthes manimaculis]|uniref:Uncharacterized protein n=1 Tax=Petrolisthes manimaculis TaxID=1843537 RepID=A0AAE1NDJ7_9EUCA|nr:hypothetical protein Pmani_039005 [Petrolisthes manimaculis]
MASPRKTNKTPATTPLQLSTKTPLRVIKSEGKEKGSVDKNYTFTEIPKSPKISSSSFLQMDEKSEKGSWPGRKEETVEAE